MYFSEFKIRSYKSYWETETIPLSLGVNLVVGKNNAGKTALLEALQVSARNMPHRSFKSIPLPGDKPTVATNFEFAIRCSREELAQLVSSGSLWAHQGSGKHDEAAEFLGDWVNSRDEFEFWFEGVSGASKFLKVIPGMRYGLAPEVLAGVHKPLVAFRSCGQNKPFEKVHCDKRKGSNFFAFQLAEQHLERVYRFESVRDVKGVCKVGESVDLAPNGANLAACVQDLQSEGRKRVARYNTLVQRVFPSIREVTAARQGERVRIEIWKFDDRKDLTFALDECGSGVAQVLCILYILVTSRFPRSILIDEPNSFLHPTAARALMEIIAEYGEQHQFVVSTHSPLIVSSAESSSIIVTEIEDGVTNLRSIAPYQRDEIAHALMAMGSRLSDVFGVDRIVWVEGETEQECFPKILEALTDLKLAGTAIRAVKHTGDFDAKDAENAFDIYENLSSSHSLLPSAVAYVFDREDKSKREIEDLQRKGRQVGAEIERIRFLDAKMYENFLLAPKAIQYAIEQDPYAKDISVDLGTIEAALHNEIGKRYREIVPDAGTQDWERNDVWLMTVLHAAEVLDHVFDFATGNTLEFRKTLHAPLMTDWILKNDPDKLQPIAKLLNEVLQRQADNISSNLPN